MNFNKSHPERLPDEVWIANASNEKDHLPLQGKKPSSSFSKIGWKTKRAGEVSYDSTGKVLVIDWPKSFPVFAKIAELEEIHPGITQDMLPD